MNNAEERSSDMEDRIMEITQSGQQTEIWIKKQESNIRDLWDNIKQANLHIIGIPEGVEKDKGMENIFEEIWSCWKLPKSKGYWVQDTRSTEGPKQVEPK